MTLQSNGGQMKVRHKAKITPYKHEVWFNKDAITNIIALSNLITQYHVTYDSNDEMFVVHRESVNTPNMHFRMHASVLHYYDPKGDDFTFNINTVSENKLGYTKRRRASKNSLRQPGLPVHEGLQMGNPEQSN
jgi:hypothetical protein